MTYIVELRYIGGVLANAMGDMRICGYWDTRADDLKSERIGVHRRLLVPSPMCIYPETRSDAAATPMTKSASYITDRTRALWRLGQARKRSNEVTDVCRAFSGGRACRGRVDEGIERPQ
jgi:hypothetical protein